MTPPSSVSVTPASPGSESGSPPVNAYEVRLRGATGEHSVTLEAPSAAAARDAAEAACDDEVVAVRLLRVLSFSCRVRDGR